MISLRVLQPDHLESLFLIEQREYPAPLRAPSYGAFCNKMLQMQGFSLADGDRIVGAIYFSDACNGIEVVMHGFVGKEYAGRWATRRNVRAILHFPFRIMGKLRVSVPLIAGAMPVLERVLQKAGFKKEGLLRRSLRIDGRVYDVVMFGLVEEDLRF